MRPITGAKTEVSKTVAEATTSAHCSCRSSTAKGTSRRTWKHRKAVPWDLHASHVSNGPRISTHLNHCIKLQLQRTRPHLYPRYVGRNSYKTLGCRRYGKRQRATKNGNQPLLLNRKNFSRIPSTTLRACYSMLRWSASKHVLQCSPQKRTAKNCPARLRLYSWILHAECFQLLLSCYRRIIGEAGYLR